ncbi:phage virion morphogenesis protein [Erythrobacter sp. SG61-1L]|uniref:phage virion morphogenesis protein n=1 Tax=Erythrobacter sp. SG61-1L TaxID=1603897 RepID=UPI0006C92C66|nr:phage virion morphogenesis protein [Erythrobacter sp. SG61-1L]
MERKGELEAIEPFFGELLQAVEPRGRRKLIDRLMRAARRANAQRIATNLEPDGAKMAPRKKRKGKRGKMFRRLGKQSSLKIRTSPEEGELRFGSRSVEDTAATHHFGLTGFVGRTRDGRVIRTKYDARRVLGFGKEQEELLDEVLRHLTETAN